ncbi:hypothetical protein NC652_029696 [Populus alba x Populus x berolinensis]|nr:hypothetical protein NC652_029696 [Populus alba x Populus x berolinensis]
MNRLVLLCAYDVLQEAVYKDPVNYIAMKSVQTLDNPFCNNSVHIASATTSIKKVYQIDEDWCKKSSILVKLGVEDEALKTWEVGQFGMKEC